MSSLFIISNTVSWADLMYQATRMNGVDYAPDDSNI